MEIEKNRTIMLLIWIFLSTSYIAASPLKGPHGSINLKAMPAQSKTYKLSNITWEILDLDKVVSMFPELQTISIRNANITNILFPNGNNNIKELQLQNIGLRTVPANLLASFPKLVSLDLSNNQIENLDPNYSFGNLSTVFLGGNRWNCSRDLDWILQLDKTTIFDLEHVLCFGEPYNEKSVLTIANFLKNIRTECPEMCNCTLPKVVIQPDTDHLEPIIEVDCSHRGLTALPVNLPARTKILKLEWNSIEELSPLINNPVYKTVIDLYLDHNRIDSIDVLEGSYWLRHFRVLTLNGNRLTEIPTYALDNALEQNANMPNAVKITLGGNPWRCDCVFTPVFQEMLQKFASEIKDLNQVKCSQVDGDQNSLQPIIELTRNSVCRISSEYSVQPLDLLNAVLASLIVLILGKLAYDYYYYKKTGRLPWIVTKMP